jgi:hypothetical protein
MLGVYNEGLLGSCLLSRLGCCAQLQPFLSCEGVLVDLVSASAVDDGGSYEISVRRQEQYNCGT